jgi:penicillin-insensitive murein endopeptidase
MPSPVRALVILTVLAGLSLGGANVRPASHAELPAKFSKAPFALMSLSVGRPNRGFQVRAKRLRESDFLEIKKGSGARSYGHPSLVLMLDRSARQVAQASRPRMKMLVGDLSREQGGPLDGHASHQSGRDADVGFYVTDAQGRPKLLDHFVRFDGQGRAKDGSGLVFDDHRNWLLVQAWLKDDRAGISHVFVSAPLRRRLLEHAERSPALRKYAPRAAVFLKQPEDAAPHDDHFHVRVSCPNGQDELCVEQSH